MEAVGEPPQSCSARRDQLRPGLGTASYARSRLTIVRALGFAVLGVTTVFFATLGLATFALVALNVATVDIAALGFVTLGLANFRFTAVVFATLGLAIGRKISAKTGCGHRVVGR